MRILIAYPGPRHSTFDVATGHERALRTLGCQVIPYQYHSFIEYYALGNQAWNERQPELMNAPDAHFLFASEHLAIAAIDCVPDAVLVVAGGALHRRAFDLLHRLRIPVVVMLTESPYNDESQAKILRHPAVVAALTNERCSAPALSEDTGKVVGYLPHSYDPAKHYQRAVGKERQTDVFFQGTLWPERVELLAGLDALPYNVHVGGGTIDGGTFVEHTLDNEIVAEHYCGTQIALNHHRTYSIEEKRRAESLGPRAYEIAACGAFQLCDATRPETFELFGGSVATYKSHDDLIAKIGYWMRRPEERAVMAGTARRKVAHCTFENRARDIVLPLLEGVTNG